MACKHLMIYTQTSAHTHTHTCPKSEPELGCRTLGSTPPGKPRSRMLSSFKLSKSSKSNWSSDQLTPRRPKRSEEIASWSAHSRMTRCSMQRNETRSSQSFQGPSWGAKTPPSLPLLTHLQLSNFESMSYWSVYSKQVCLQPKAGSD